jgi:hypothetical protein
MRDASGYKKVYLVMVAHQTALDEFRVYRKFNIGGRGLG